MALLMIYTRVRSVSESCKILSLTSKSRVGILWDPDDPAAAIAFNEYEAVAFPLKVQLHSLKVRGPKPNWSDRSESAIKVPAVVTWL